MAMPIFGRKAPTSTAAMLRKQGIKVDPETRRMMDLADRLEANIPGAELEFGNAWLAAFARHGHDNSNAASAFTPASIKGEFYNTVESEWQQEWKAEKVSAAEFIERHWDQIERTCFRPPCGPPKD
jgi:hypothetical protein